MNWVQIVLSPTEARFAAEALRAVLQRLAPEDRVHPAVYEALARGIEALSLNLIVLSPEEAAVNAAALEKVADSLQERGKPEMAQTLRRAAQGLSDGFVISFDSEVDESA